MFGAAVTNAMAPRGITNPHERAESSLLLQNFIFSCSKYLIPDFHASTLVSCRRTAGELQNLASHEAGDDAYNAPGPQPSLSLRQRVASIFDPSFSVLRESTVFAARAVREQSQALLKVLQPTTLGKHTQVFTGLFSIVTIAIFMFMAGETNGLAAAEQLKAGVVWPTGPTALGYWQHFWSVSPDYTFKSQYLLEWGGRYVPADHVAGTLPHRPSRQGRLHLTASLLHPASVC